MLLYFSLPYTIQRISKFSTLHAFTRRTTRSQDSDKCAVYIFYLCYCFRLIFPRVLREYPSVRACRRKRVCAGGIHYGKCTENSTLYTSALTHACILIRENARVQLPTSFSITALPLARTLPHAQRMYT